MFLLGYIMTAAPPTPASTSPAVSPYQFHQVYLDHRDALVRLRCETAYGPVFHSGFFVRSDGLVLTSTQGIGPETVVALVDAQGHSLPGKVLDIDATLGIALVKFSSAVPLPAMQIVADADPRLGQWLVALRHDDKGQPSGAAGGVSKRWTALHPLGARYYVVDVTGVPGAPLLNLQGQVVAMTLHAKGARRLVALSAQSFAAFVLSAAPAKDPSL